MTNARDKANNPQLNFTSKGIDDNADAVAITIDSSENVGIGTTSPQHALDVTSSASVPVRIQSTASSNMSVEINAPTGYNANILLKENDANAFFIGHNASSSALTFYDGTANTERMRVTSAGTVLIGKTSSSFSTVGQEFRSGGVTILGRSGGEPLTLNRTDSDGGILNFKKDNTLRGSINTGNGSLHITEATYGGIAFSSVGAGDINPCNPDGTARDNAMSLGQPSARFKDLYLSQGAFIGGTGSANQLDDYEEGTFTPSLVSTGATFAYTHQKGVYTKVGNAVTFNINIQLDGSGNSFSANSVDITGLPFNSANVSGQLYRFFIASRLVDVSSSGSGVVANLGHNDTTMDILEFGDNSTSGNIASNQLSSSSGQLFVNGTYYV